MLTGIVVILGILATGLMCILDGDKFDRAVQEEIEYNTRQDE